MDNQVLSQLDQIQDVVKGLVEKNLQQPSVQTAYSHTNLDEIVDVDRKITKKELETREQVWGGLYAVIGHVNMNDFQTKRIQGKLGLDSSFTLAKNTLKTIQEVKKTVLNSDLEIKGILKVREEE